MFFDAARASALRVSTSRRCPSAKRVSKARLDLPEPLTPAKRTSLRLGTSMPSTLRSRSHEIDDLDEVRTRESGSGRWAKRSGTQPRQTCALRVGLPNAIC